MVAKLQPGLAGTQKKCLFEVGVSFPRSRVASVSVTRVSSFFPRWSLGVLRGRPSGAVRAGGCLP